jgi:hypothetical protein
MSKFGIIARIAFCLSIFFLIFVFWNDMVDIWNGMVDIADRHEGFAAWVQAVGVIMALVGSFGLAWWERRKKTDDEAKTAKIRESRNLDNVSCIVDRIRTFTLMLSSDALLTRRRESQTNDTIPEEADTLSWLLYESGFEKFQDYNMICIGTDLRAQVKYIARVLNPLSLNTGEPTQNPAWQRAASVAKEANKNCEKFLTAAYEYKLRKQLPKL